LKPEEQADPAKQKSGQGGQPFLRFRVHKVQELGSEQDPQNKELGAGKIKYPGKQRKAEMSEGEVIAAECQKNNNEQDKSKFHGLLLCNLITYHKR